jgi:hypothetical protein
LLPNLVAGDEETAQQILSHLIFASVYNSEGYVQIVRTLRQKRACLPTLFQGPVSAAGVLQQITKSARISDIDSHTVSAPTLSASPRVKLKIALCVSGQLRGFDRAFNSWSCLGLDTHDVSTFVHTWIAIGGNPSPVRAFRGHFLRNLIDIALRLKLSDFEFLSHRYPTLTADMQHDGVATDAQLRKVYGKDAIVEFNDESQSPFSGWDNQTKMLHKIREAHKLAEQLSGPFDLMIRVRPDIRLAASTSPNWHDILRDSLADRAIFVDDEPMFHGGGMYGIGDMFAVGHASVMESYSSTLQELERARSSNQPVYGAPSSPYVHSSLAYHTLYQGIQVRRIQGVQFLELMNRATYKSERIKALLLKDIGETPRDEIDQALLDSLERDLRDES